MKYYKDNTRAFGLNPLSSKINSSAKYPDIYIKSIVIITILIVHLLFSRFDDKNFEANRR